jgi:hypothetical protein
MEPTTGSQSTTTLDVGMTQEAIADKVISRAANRLAKSLMNSERLMEPLRSVLTKTIDAEAHRIADEEIRPWAAGQIENVVMQRTNEWGEKHGASMSFRQYLVERAGTYLSEKVDYDGRSAAEYEASRGDSYNFHAVSTRATWMVDKHLHRRIEEAMKDALANANSQIAIGIQEAVKMKLAEISAALKVEVKVPR